MLLALSRWFVRMPIMLLVIGLAGCAEYEFPSYGYNFGRPYYRNPSYGSPYYGNGYYRTPNYRYYSNPP